MEGVHKGVKAKAQILVELVLVQGSRRLNSNILRRSTSHESVHDQHTPSLLPLPLLRPSSSSYISKLTSRSMLLAYSFSNSSNLAQLNR